jgi:hypothetical protein
MTQTRHVSLHILDIAISGTAGMSCNLDSPFNQNFPEATLAGRLVDEGKLRWTSTLPAWPTNLEFIGRTLVDQVLPFGELTSENFERLCFRLAGGAERVEYVARPPRPKRLGPTFACRPKCLG